MIVCVCRGVSDRAIRAAVAGGAKSIDEIADACRAGDGCGACHDELRRLAGDSGGARPSGCIVPVAAVACRPTTSRDIHEERS
jgi:bacterioferritin-associated ferredoxin